MSELYPIVVMQHSRSLVAVIAGVMSFVFCLSGGKVKMDKLVFLALHK